MFEQDEKNNGSHSENIQKIIDPNPHELNTSEGGEFLDDAIRTEDQSFGNTIKNKTEEFLLAIHIDQTSKNPSPSPEQMRAALKPYQDWISDLITQGKLASPPKQWDMDGRVVKQNDDVQNGPYAEKNESIGGLFLLLAKDYDEAVEIAKGCPIIKYGAIIEVRMAIPAG
jgi:hypothetical protein